MHNQNLPKSKSTLPKCCKAFDCNNYAKNLEILVENQIETPRENADLALQQQTMSIDASTTTNKNIFYPNFLREIQHFCRQIKIPLEETD